MWESWSTILAVSGGPKSSRATLPLGNTESLKPEVSTPVQLPHLTHYRPSPRRGQRRKALGGGVQLSSRVIIGREVAQEVSTGATVWGNGRAVVSCDSVEEGPSLQ